MLTVLIVTQGITLVLLVALAVALLAVARQVGVLHTRLAPAGALTTAQGPAVGDLAAPMQVTTIDGTTMTIGGALPPGRRRLVLFVSADCPVCKRLIPFAKSFAHDERVELVLAGDDDAARQRALIQAHGLAGFPFVNGPALGRAFGVDKLPHAVLLDESGTIVARGLVNSREHLESLVVSHEMGVRSVQDYLSGLKVRNG